MFYSKKTQHSSSTAAFSCFCLFCDIVQENVCMYSSSYYIGMEHVCTSACKINLMQLLLRRLEANNTVVVFHILSRFGTNNSCTRPIYTFWYISIHFKPTCRKKKYAKKEKRQIDEQFEFEIYFVSSLILRLLIGCWIDNVTYNKKNYVFKLLLWEKEIYWSTWHGFPCLCSTNV